MLLLAGCGGTVESPLTLWPPATAISGRPLWLDLERGEGIGFDPFVVRLNGTQQLLEPVVRDGRLGASLELDGVGDALVGFSTEPRLVERDGAAVWSSQHVKTIFSVTRAPGAVTPPSASVCHRIGLRFELVPMIDPLPLLEGDELPVRVRFDGPALAGCRVQLAHRPRGDAAAEVVVAEAISDAVGTVVLTVRGPGFHMVTAEHHIEHAGARVERFQAALSFATGVKR